MKRVMFPFAMLLLGLLAACGGNSVKPTAAAPAESDIKLPAELFIAERPTGDLPLAEAKKSAKRGDAIVVRGVIRGVNSAFVANRAMMQIADESVPACSMNPDRPWDLHCETPESMQKNTATIQITGADGKPLKRSLQGAGGLEHMSIVIIKGTVANNENGNLLIDAKEIFVEKRKG